MMNLDSKHGLAFLLSMSALPMAGCPSDDPETTNTGNDTSSSSSGDSTNSTTMSTSNSTTMSTSADSSDTSMTVSTTEPGSSSDSTGSSDGTGSDSSDGSSGSDSSSGSTGGASQLCEEFAAHFVECVPAYAKDEAYIAGECDYAIGYYAGYSAECGTATEELYACLGSVDCGFFEKNGGAGCEEEVAATEEFCGKKGSSTTVSDEGGEEGPVEDGG